VDIGETSFDGRAVLIDAQVTGGIPTGTTVGVNGLASDLSILNLMGTNAQTTHYLLPEPLEVMGNLQLLGTEYKFGVSFLILVLVLLFRPTGIFRGKVF